MKIVSISDTHMRHKGIILPQADVLVCAGDFTARGLLSEIEDFMKWFTAQNVKHKVIIAGNHDFLFERNNQVARGLMGRVHYLQDSGVTIEGKYFYGSPWQPRFYDWSFNLERGEPLKRVWSKIPVFTDILVTHCPPAGILDKTLNGEEVGCADLSDRVKIIKPKVHIFGHIHESYGTLIKNYENGSTTKFVNAAICDRRYYPSHAPILIEI